jgi:LacI family transcriptional regulator
MDKLLKLKEPPTAIVTINDYVALDAIEYAKKMKLKINKNLCFVSYANLPITSYLKFPPLASVEQYPYEQAKKATEILFELFGMENGETSEQSTYNNVLIEGQLIIHNN